MAEKGTRNYTGVVMAVGILLIMGMAIAIALDVPISKSFSFPTVPSAGPDHQLNITLYADASGWDYNHGKVNPTIVIPPNTQIAFTVIEEDNQPHTLTIAPGAQESSTHATLLSQTDITTTPGHVSHASAYFTTTGEYTYWCTIHPVTMVGQLYVNTSASLPTNISGSGNAAALHGNASAVNGGNNVPSAMTVIGTHPSKHMHTLIPELKIYGNMHATTPMDAGTATHSSSAVNENNDISGMHILSSRNMIVRLEN